MATKVFYTLNTTATSPNWFGVLQEGGSAPSAAASAYGWGNAKVAINFWRARLGATNTSTQTQSTTFLTSSSLFQGSGATNTTAGNAFRSPTTYSGSFANTAWSFSFGVRTGAASHAGAMRIQIWRGANADGTSATRIGSVGVGSTVTLNATATTFTSSGTVAAPGVITLNNEYLFFEVEWQGTTAGTSNSCSTLFYQGVCTVTTPNFVAAYSMPGLDTLIAFTFRTAGLARSIQPLVASVGTFASSFKDATLTFSAAAPPNIQVSWAEVSGVEGTAVSGAYTLTADKGSFTLTGFATGLIYSRKLSMPAALGTFALAGTATALRVAYKLGATTGAFTLTGIATALNYGASKTLTAVTGALTFAGSATGLVYVRRLVMPAVTGVFTLANPLTALRIARRLVAITGVFTLSGQVTALRIGRALVAIKGTVTLAGTVTSLAASRIVTAAQGALTLTYWAASLTRPGSFGLLASTGALTFTRIDANLRATRKLTAVVGNFALSGKVTGLLRNCTLTAVTGSIAFSGIAVNLRYARKFITSVGAFTLTGSATSLAVVKNLSAAAGALLFTGKDANLVYTSFSGIIALPGNFVFSWQEVDFDIQRLPPRRQFVRFVRPVSHIMRQW